MKRIVSLLIVFTMILSAFTMTGCGEKAQDEKGKEALNVGIVVSSKFGDKSFNDSAKDGVDKLKEDYGVAVTLIECKGDNFKQNLTKATEKADIIVAVGWEFVEIGEIAADYPDKKFIWVDNVVNKIEEFPNVMCITYAQNEGAFVAGYIAAKTSNTGVVGVVGGENRSTINDFIVAYEQGAEYADPNVDVKKFTRTIMKTLQRAENPR